MLGMYSYRKSFDQRNKTNFIIYLRRYLLSVFLIVVLIIIATIFMVGIGGDKSIKDTKGNITNNNQEFIMKPNNVIFNQDNGGGPIIKVYISKEKKIEEMYLEEYVRGVVCAEMQANFEKEALKAQAIAARTYALAHMKSYDGQQCSDAKGGDVCDTVHSQVYMSKEDRLSGWAASDRGEYWNKITEAVQETEGEILMYNNKLVMSPYYFAISGGRTASAVDVFATSEPYLQSVDSPGEEVAPKYKTTAKFNYKDLAMKINNQYPKAKVVSNNLKNQINIVSRGEGGFVKEMRAGSVKLSGAQFRNILNLNSSDFTINFKQSEVEIVCMGYGHGVGMSQWGANAMAKKGKKCDEILIHYYQGVKIDNLATIKE